MATRIILKDNKIGLTNPASGYKFLGYNNDALSERLSNGDINPISGTSYIELTYVELKSLSDSSRLVKGQTYKITDFNTINPLHGYSLLYNNTDIHTSSVIEPLILKASSVNTFDSIAISETYPDHEIIYDINESDIVADVSSSDGGMTDTTGILTIPFSTAEDKYFYFYIEWNGGNDYMEAEWNNVPFGNNIIPDNYNGSIAQPIFNFDGAELNINTILGLIDYIEFSGKQTLALTKGVIKRRTDKVKNVSLPFDFLNCKWKRYYLDTTSDLSFQSNIPSNYYSWESAGSYPQSGTKTITTNQDMGTFDLGLDTWDTFNISNVVIGGSWGSGNENVVFLTPPNNVNILKCYNTTFYSVSNLNAVEIQTSLFYVISNLNAVGAKYISDCYVRTIQDSSIEASNFTTSEIYSLLSSKIKTGSFFGNQFNYGIINVEVTPGQSKVVGISNMTNNRFNSRFEYNKIEGKFNNNLLDDGGTPNSSLIMHSSLKDFYGNTMNGMNITYNEIQNIKNSTMTNSFIIRSTIKNQDSGGQPTNGVLNITGGSQITDCKIDTWVGNNLINTSNITNCIIIGQSFRDTTLDGSDMNNVKIFDSFQNVSIESSNITNSSFFSGVGNRTIQANISDTMVENGGGIPLTLTSPISRATIMWDSTGGSKSVQIVGGSFVIT